MTRGFNSVEHADPTALAAGVALMFWLLLVGGCGREGEESENRPRPTPGTSRELAVQSATAPGRVVVVTPAARPASKPTGPLAPGTTCVTAECHAAFAAAAQVHAPVAERACSACHKDDVGGHRFPLKRASAADSCTFCHAVSGTASHQHKALEQGCLTCHDPHASRAKFLLKADTVEQLCRTCHETPTKRFAHRPFADGQCTLCHQPHEADNVKLLRGGAGANHCFTCHADLKTALASARHVHKPAARDCNDCHSPHATDEPHLLSAPVERTCSRCHAPVAKHAAATTVKHAAMTADRSCLNCHAPHLADYRPLMRERMDRVCLTCHDQPLKAADGHTVAAMANVLTKSKFLHGAIRAGDCSSCHDAHGAAEHALLVRAFPDSSYARFEVNKYALCFQTCHSKEIALARRTTSVTNFRDGDLNLHYLHVNRDEKGRSCKTCHALHGSNLPNHMAGEVAFERSGWAMPVGFEKLTTGGSCAPGCHAPRTYDRAKTPTSAPIPAPALGGVP